MSYDRLGALALLAHVPPAAARDAADVAAIARIAGHTDDVETLDAYRVAGSRAVPPTCRTCTTPASRAGSS